MSVRGVATSGGGGGGGSSNFGTLRTPYYYGAAGGGADDTIPLAAWAAYGSGTINPNTSFKTTAPVVIPSNSYFVGGGITAQILGNGVTGGVVQAGDGSASTGGIVFRDFGIGGSGTNALRLNKVGSSVFDNLRCVMSGASTDLFFFTDVQSSSLNNLATNAVTVNPSNSCFLLTGFFNAVTVTSWVTSNIVPINVAFNASATGSVFNGVTVQGGTVGLQILNGGLGNTFTKLYSENTPLPLQLGDSTVAGRRALGFTFDSPFLQGANSSHPQFSTRATAIDAQNCYGVTINSPVPYGLISDFPTILSFSGGGGTGAAGVVRINAAGTIHSAAVTCGGSGYGSAPTVTITATNGTGAVITATVSGGVVTGLTVSNAGTGYLAPNTPTALRVTNAYGLTINAAHQALSNSTLLTPLWPYIVRTSGADPLSSVAIFNDRSTFVAGAIGGLNMVKSESLATDFLHYLVRSGADASAVSNTYVLPVY